MKDSGFGRSLFFFVTMFLKSRPRSTLAIVLLSISLTALVVLIAMNFAIGNKKATSEITHLYSIEDPQFLRTMSMMLGPGVIGGNRVEPLVNGDQIFPAMLAAIRGAKKTISFETYIYWSETIGDQFADALAERARAGVKVHLLVDAVGSSKLDGAQLHKMEDAGVAIKKYRPLRWYNIAHLNNRTHRKLLVVDGKIGFTGGVGIAGQWTGHAQDPEHWRDSHFKVEGPVVAEMQAVLLDNWTKTTGEILHGGEYFPALAQAGNESAQIFSSSPTGGSESMALMYQLAMTAAKKSIDLSSSYFVPDDATRKVMLAAMHRGVRIRVITPGTNMDAEVVRRASRGNWGELLAGGAQMHEYQPTMYHCKVMIVDDLLVSVGSTNFDQRSFRLNDEANLNVFDANFARSMTAIFEQDLKNAKRITLAQWEERPFGDKAIEFFASRFGALL